MRKFTSGDSWRIKVAAGWACFAPVGAMALVVALGNSAPPGQLVVDGTAAGNQTRPDSVFDDLAAEVPDQPGVDGRLGTPQDSKVQVPVTGVVDGKAVLPTGGASSVEGIPSSVLPAYQRAAAALAVSQPGCGLTWPLLAGIGKVESSHASGGRVDATGLTRGRILGPVLDGGPGMASISDTDQGRYDGDTRWDRAVGPMQFIPGTWAAFGADGNGDGVKDPHNVYDAARAAGEYLCAGGADLHRPQGLVQAVLRYNHSMDYVSTVLRWMQLYSKSAVKIPDQTGVIPPPTSDKGNVQRRDDPTGVPTPTPTPTMPSSQPSQTVATPPRSTIMPPWPPKSQPPSTKPPWSPPSVPPKPTSPPTQTPSQTPSQTPTDTPTLPPTGTPTPAPTDTPTPTVTPTPAGTAPPAGTGTPA
jgi:membrane-bound lytic murein transglycosylase B